MYFGHGTGGYKLTRGDVWCSSGAICWRMCQHWAHGLFCVCVCVCVCVRAGKPPAGPVCGITPQDPSRAGSQKRKQLSDNELLFCDQTSAFLRSGWGSWERVKNHTHARLYTRCTHTYCMHTCAYSEALHTHIKEATLTTRWTTYPIWTEPVKPAIIYTSQGHIFYTNCTEPTQHKHNKIQSSPHTYKHPCVQCHLKILRGGGKGRKKNLRLSKNAFLFLVRALKGLYGSLWQQRGFAMQTAHILRLTLVNRAGSFHTATPEPADLNAASVSHMTVSRDWGSTVSRHRGGS